MKAMYEVAGFDDPIAVTMSWVPSNDCGDYCLFVHAKHPVMGTYSRYVHGETNVYRAADCAVFDMVVRRVYD